QVGGSASENDGTIGGQNLEWNGNALAPLSDTATNGQLGQFSPLRLAYGGAISGFPFYLKSSADHITPFTSGIVSGQISRNAGAFVALQSGVFTETGLGFFRVNLTSGDLAATTIAMLFTANGISGGSSDPLPLTILTQPTSGHP